MYSRFVLIFLFYLTGGLLTPVLGNVRLTLKKSLVFVMAEDGVEEDKLHGVFGKSLVQVNNIPDLSPGYLSGVAPAHSALFHFFSLGHHLTQHDRTIAGYLYLLFHALLFYDPV